MWDGTEETQILKKTCGQLYNNSTEHVSEIISAVADICCVKLKCIKRLLIHINHFIKFSIFFFKFNFFSNIHQICDFESEIKSNVTMHSQIQNEVYNKLVNV